MNGKQLKNSILQWAIQGKLVPQDPNDEPASVLLERIREEKARLVKEKKIKKDKNESIIYRGDDNSYYEKFADGTVKCIDDEIPFEIPHSWCWVRLIGVGKTETGTTPSKTHPEYFGDYMPFIGPGNIQGNKIVSYTQGISEIGVDYCRPVPQNTILQVCIGGSIGKAAITTEWSAFNQQINSVEPYQSIDYKYVFYTLLTDYFKKAMIERSTGTATPIINRSNWEGIILPIPPQLEQQRIVTRIEELMHIADKYEKSQEALDKLNAEIFDKLKKSVLQEAIQGRLVPQDPNDEPASVLLERIKAEKAKLFKEGKLKKKDLVDSVIFKGEDNKYYEKIGSQVTCIDDDIPFEIPTSWAWVRLEQLCTYIQRGKSPKYSEIRKYPVVAQKCNQWTGFSLEKALFLDPATIGSYGEERFLQDGDLLWNSTGLGTLGRMAIYDSSKNEYGLAVADSHVTVIRAIPSMVSSEYLFKYFSSHTVQSVIEDKSEGSTKQKELATSTVKSYMVPLPPYEEQLRIVAAANNVIASITRR